MHHVAKRKCQLYKNSCKAKFKPWHSETLLRDRGCELWEASSCSRFHQQKSVVCVAMFNKAGNGAQTEPWGIAISEKNPRRNGHRPETHYSKNTQIHPGLWQLCWNRVFCHTFHSVSQRAAWRNLGFGGFGRRSQQQYKYIGMSRHE